MGFYGGAWNEEGQSLQFQTLVSGTVTNYSNSAKATPITGTGTQKFDNASGEWYIQECALDYTGPEAGNSAGSFWWGDGTVQNYRGSTKAALTQKIASAEADQVAGNAVFGTNAYMDFNQPGTQDASINLKIENGYLEGCHNEAKIKSKGQQQFAQSSQQFDSLSKLDESEASIRLEALAMNQKISTLYVFIYNDAQVDQISEMQVTARSIFDNVSIDYQLPSIGGDEEIDLGMIRQ